MSRSPPMKPRLLLFANRNGLANAFLSKQCSISNRRNKFQSIGVNNTLKGFIRFTWTRNIIKTCKLRFLSTFDFLAFALTELSITFVSCLIHVYYSVVQISTELPCVDNKSINKFSIPQCASSRQEVVVVYRLFPGFFMKGT